MLGFFLLLSLGSLQYQFTSEIRAYFTKDNPQLLEFNAFENDFNQQDNVVFVVHSKGQPFFNVENIKAIKEMTEAAWQIPYTRRVVSLTNLPKTRAEDDTIISDPVINSSEEVTLKKVRELQEESKKNPLFKALTGNQENGSLIIVSLSLANAMDNPSFSVINAAHALQNEIAAEYPNLDIYLSGSIMANTSVAIAIINDLLRLLPICSTFIFLLLLWLLRSLSGTLLTMSIIPLSIFSTFGLASWLGIPITPVSGTIPTILAVIAVADSVHFLTSYYHSLHQGHPRQIAVMDALRMNAIPMLLTSITTAIGLLCLNFSDSPPYRYLGNTVALGAMLAFLFTITLLPSLLLWLPDKMVGIKEGKEIREPGAFRGMLLLGGFLTKHYREGLFIGIGAALLFGAQINKNIIDDQWDKYFGDSFEITDSFRVVEQYFGGAHYIHFRIDSGEDQGIKNPQYLKDLTRLTAWLQNQTEVGRVDSFATHMQLVQSVLYPKDPKELYDSRESLGQSLFLYELALPYGASLDDIIDIDKRATRLTVYTNSIASEEMIDFAKRVQGWAKKENLAFHVDAGTGLDIMFANMAQRNSYKLLSGTLFGLLLISVILIWVFRSIKLGLLSLIPNLLPVIVAYGAWGLYKGHIDLAISTGGAMSLGLVVDDTIHFLSKYRFARIHKQLSVEEALLFTFKTVGSAMLITSVVLVIGFSSLVFSDFYPSSNMGSLLAFSIACALVFDIMLLPGLLILFDRSNKYYRKLALNTESEVQAGANPNPASLSKVA